MEVVHAGAADSGPPAHILRYYDEHGTGRGGDTPGGREPQLRCEWREGVGGEGGRVSVRLFRPEAVLLPSALVSMYSYVDGLAQRLALVPGGGGPSLPPAGSAPTLPGIEEASLGGGVWGGSGVGGGSGGVRVDVEVLTRPPADPAPYTLNRTP